MKSMHDILKTACRHTFIRRPVANRWLRAVPIDWTDCAVDVIDILAHEIAELAHERGLSMDCEAANELAQNTFDQAQAYGWLRWD